MLINIFGVTIKAKTLYDNVLTPLPSKAYPDDAGFDLRAIKTVFLPAGGTGVADTGLAFEIPTGYEIQIRPRSGMFRKNGIMAIFGTVDCSYRGEVSVQLVNLSKESYVVDPLDRVAQAVIAPVVPAKFEFVKELTPSLRNTNGFGSSGR